ncbi:MAG: DUF1697 domain-containing protein [Gemmatimonadetes bacterium]|nr:DUF1697 domain-containing protein [Gemmatimonadota bacterium]
MALVVLLRGVNVGGHRTFRPAALAKELTHLDAVNIGAAGTFVIRRPVARTELRRELERRLPFETEIVICEGRDIVALLAGDPFAGQAEQLDIVRFVSVLARAPRTSPGLPLALPERGPWLLRILERRDRFVLGMYRRRMKAIGHLGALDHLFGVPATTRSWSTVGAIVRALEGA